MAKFRKKTVIVDAEQWFPGKLIEGVIEWNQSVVGPESMAGIKTPAGWMHVGSGDWILTNDLGEKFPCKNDAFLAAYEPIEE